MPKDFFAFATRQINSHIVELRKGIGSPLFCFPGSDGSVHPFREMVALLPKGPPIYAIDKWLCYAEEDFTVEQLAAFWLDQIKDIQKVGPYYFCGYSFGGLVAYEIATRLVDEGDSVGLVALLDAPNPAFQFRKTTYLIDRLKKYCFRLVRGEIKAFRSGGLAFLKSRGGAYFMPVIKTAFGIMNKPLPATLRSDAAFLKAWRSYLPKQYKKSVVCFRSEDRGPEYDCDPSMGWEICAAGGVQVHIVPGGHVDMMGMRSIGVIADKLAAYLDSGSDHPNKLAGF